MSTRVPLPEDSRGPDLDGDARLVEPIARRWLAGVPDPLRPAERAAGYPTHRSVFQAEFSDNVIFTRTQILNRVYEALRRDHLHLGRPDMSARHGDVFVVVTW